MGLYCTSPTDCLSLSLYPSVILTVSPLPSSKTVVCTSLDSPWVCPFSWKSGQTDPGSDSSQLYNDSDPSLFIKSCCPLRLHSPLPPLSDHPLYPGSLDCFEPNKKMATEGNSEGCGSPLNTTPRNMYWLEGASLLFLHTNAKFKNDVKSVRNFRCRTTSYTCHLSSFLACFENCATWDGQQRTGHNIWKNVIIVKGKLYLYSHLWSLNVCAISFFLFVLYFLNKSL